MRRKRTVPEIKYYFLFNKPAGTVCSTVSDSHKTVFQFFPDEILLSPDGAKLHTVGRLDCDTEGLLIFTNDGKFSNYLTRPENKIKKTYFVRLRENFTDKKQVYEEAAKNGVILPPEKKAPEQQSAPFELNFDCGNKTNELEITVTEGKFHEVKRIFRALENEVIYLKRVGFGQIRLDPKLSPGHWRKLSDEEKNQAAENTTT